MERNAYPSDVSDDERAFVAPYLTSMSEAAPPREHSLREVFKSLRWLARTGASWRLRPHDLPPWKVVYDQTQRWLKAGVFEALVHDLRELLRTAQQRSPRPSAAIFDSRTLQSSPEIGARAGYDGHKRKKGSNVHLAVDTRGSCWGCMSPPLMSRIGHKSRNWPSRYRRPPARRLKWPL